MNNPLKRKVVSILSVENNFPNRSSPLNETEDLSIKLSKTGILKNSPTKDENNDSISSRRKKNIKRRNLSLTFSNSTSLGQDIKAKMHLVKKSTGDELEDIAEKVETWIEENEGHYLDLFKERIDKLRLRKVDLEDPDYISTDPFIVKVESFDTEAQNEQANCLYKEIEQIIMREIIMKALKDSSLNVSSDEISMKKINQKKTIIDTYAEGIELFDPSSIKKLDLIKLIIHKIVTIE